jgi:hypothetical protein
VAPHALARPPAAPAGKLARGSLASAIGIAVILTLFWTILGVNGVPGALRHDFLNIYVGGTLAASGRLAELHNQDVQLRLERELVPTLDNLVPFVRPHFYALLLSPLGLFPLNTALWLWIGLHTTVLFGCWFWAVRQWGPDALIFGSLYLPTALGISHGQDGVFMLVVVISAYRLASQGRDGAAGAVAALTLMKFHLTFLIPVCMIVQKRWRMLGAFCVAAGGLVLVSAVTAGWAGMVSYVELLRAKNLPHLSPSPELMVNIHSLTANFGIEQPLVSVVLIALVSALVFVAVWHAPLWRFWCASLIGSILVGPHVFGYDAAMLLLPVWLVAAYSRSTLTRGFTTVLTIPLLFFCSALGVPWSTLPSLVLLCWLGALAWENRTEIAEPMGVA